MNIILFGPPLAGKGTQCKKIIAEFELKHLSTGDVLRAEKRKKTHLGLEAEKYSSQGKLAPDELVCKVVENFYLENENEIGFLFDGYPRNTTQAKHLLNFLKNQDSTIDKVFLLNVEQKDLFNRAERRAKEENRKDDKDPKIVLARINDFKTLTIPAIRFIKERGIEIIELNGGDSVEEIYGKIQRNLK